MTAARVLLWTGAAILLLSAVGLCLAFRPAMAPIEPPSRGLFTPASIDSGANLAHIGDCAVCHTAPRGATYAGGRAIATPFGQIYATNITPDPETGIGRWSLAAFRRALREGVARNGAHLYPAFPYDHFTYLNDGNISDLYAFMMTRPAVRVNAPANQLVFPLGFRPLLARWKFLFFRPSATQLSSGGGYYLVSALGHCGACHTPHNALGAEETNHALAGGWAEGWYAPPLNAASPAAVKWTPDALYVYFRSGLSLSHAAAAGPMGPVTRELAKASDSDVHAMANYVAERMNGGPLTSTADRAQAAARRYPAGALVFAGACAACHEAGAPMMLQGRPNLSLGTPLHEATPRDTVQIVLQGLRPPVGRAGPAIPAFAGSLRDQDMADLMGYLRARYTDQPPWPGDMARETAKARKAGGR